MKKILFYFFVFCSFIFKSQTYPSYKIHLLSLIHPNDGSVGIGPDDRRYNGCWGWYQASLNKEYAIVGASNGTYFIDVTNPLTPSVSAFVAGVSGVTVREIKTYQNYCFITCDYGTVAKLQIIDMSNLPSSVTIVHNNNIHFASGHTHWIDGNKLYVGGVTYANNTGSSMNIYGISTPSAPVLHRELKQDFPAISYVHDMYVRNDTIFASCGNQGLYVFKYNSSTNTFSQLGSYTGYAASAYNHSSGLTQNGKYLLFCDESPAGLPIRFVDVQNLNNIQPIQNFQPFVTTTPHNPFLIGNKWAIVSCYQEGLYIYDISQPGNVAISGYFDTHPQGGANVGNYFGQDYRGNWGAYPYLPSGIIIAADMQNGIFILDPTDAYSNPVGIKNNNLQHSDLIMYPSPAKDFLSVHYTTIESSVLELKNMFGQTILKKQFTGPVSEKMNVDGLENGTYIISVLENGHSINKKIVINH
jgi:choice-of-anchor B domain-containing protein